MKLFKNIQQILDHAEEDAEQAPLSQFMDDQAHVAHLANIAANVWCSEEDGYDSVDRGAYRAAWYHTMKQRKR